MAVGGTWGKLLHVDLTEGKHWVEEPPDDVYLKLVGGRGLTAYLLLRDLPKDADPLGPENLLIFAPGILQGSNLPGSGRHGVGGHVIGSNHEPAIEKPGDAHGTGENRK